MQYEVENKFRVAELSSLASQLTDLGAEFRGEVEQVDVYFSHPVRDFAATDEAFRIRRIGETNLVTYKGPKIHEKTKTRHEIELPLASGAGLVEDYGVLLETLGFGRVAEVKKRRRSGRLQWNECSVALALDKVVGLGDFVELEIVADQDRLQLAQSVVVELAGCLELHHPERRSYLEMLLAERPR